MTRQHFKAIASALADSRPETTSVDPLQTWKHSCESIARACRTFNNNFDYCRFLKACDYYEDGK